METQQEEPLSSIIFLGTGSSGGVPSMKCLLQPSDPPCKVCSQFASTSPEKNPNYRCNTSLLIDYCPDGSEHTYIVIDVGKTFREQVLRWFTCHNIPWINSIILTHEHADAVHGLDEIREVQCFGPNNEIKPMPIYLNQFTMDSIALKFSYLVPREVKGEEVPRRISHIDWKIIESSCDKPFVIFGLKFVPLPVMHGEDYASLGFLFGGKYKVAYISDASRIPKSTEDAISEHKARQVDLLIIDSNSTKQFSSRSTHFHFEQTLKVVKQIFPKSALLVGMNHSFDHDKKNEFLAKWSAEQGIQVQLAYDGLRLFIDL